MRDDDLRAALDTIAVGVQTPPFSEIQRRSAISRRVRLASLGIVPAALFGAAVLVSAIYPGLLSGGGTRPQEPMPVARASAPAGIHPTGSVASQLPIQIQRSGSYGTVEALVAQSSLVAILTATSTHSVADVNGLPFTSTTMRLDRVIRGAAPKGETLQLRQIGPANLADSVTIVEAGHQYVAFLGRVSFSPGTTTGEWYVVGLMAGLYEVRGDVVTRLDDGSPRLPTGIPASELEAAIKGAPTQKP